MAVYSSHSHFVHFFYTKRKVLLHYPRVKRFLDVFFALLAH